ncbi:putative small methyltransferase [Desulfamplus magnetovallimortis]|uniref:Putative small methyltransferase n=2 Tax=Desulfamplus magnetovallimortis TaxID=1246637 RepID=A0A1W1H733_9BACT|nr:16S rRNA (guanine(966)-N(2))-methyltransferase RsmD [Desulfamplus magnetovallimortis]SLM28282.1 putative small methyltransferase [Desulfamplus magnetovallimortis]
MRIISGTCRGRKLISPGNNSIRPTSDRVRESVFNILGEMVKGASVLDLFAGTGALGIESLSRGARSAIFADVSRQSCRIIRQNTELCKMTSQSTIITCDLSKASLPYQLTSEKFNLLFMDPPYNKGFVSATLDNNTLLDTLASDAVIIIEHAPGEPIPGELERVKLYDQRKYGKTVVSFLTPVEQSGI